MDLPTLLLLIGVVFAVFAGLAAIDGADSRGWEDTRPWWPDEAPRAV
jgi:hypothetical protein